MTTITIKQRRSLAQTLNTGARTIQAALKSTTAGQPLDAAALSALADALLQSAADLDPKQAERSADATGRTVSLRYAYQRLSSEGFVRDARFPTVPLYYEGAPISHIGSDLCSLTLRSGRVIVGLGPDTRLSRA